LSFPVSVRDKNTARRIESALIFLFLTEVMMLTTPDASAEVALQQLAERFSQWRQDRRTPYGPRIPEALWTEAARLTQRLPVTRVAKALHLRPHTLRRRSSLGTTPATPAAREVPFVEVSLGARRANTTEVEIQRPDGTRLRITYSEAAPALAALVQTFLEHH
jgi:hypothetical protein